MPVSETDVHHFLGRVGFAPDAADVTHFVGREIPDIVNEVVSQVRDLPEVPPWLAIDTPYLANQKNVDWWLNRMITSRWSNATSATPSPLVEKLTLFWHGHFASEFQAVNDATIMWEQNQIFRAEVLGDFPQLCNDISIHGAMLIYLNNESNVKGGVQENFARELMELFTMGVGNYTEADVVSMARAWTGHGIIGWDPVQQRVDPTYQFYADRHDDDLKVLFGIEADWDGPDTIVEICRGARQQQTANFIATKLWRYFISSTADATAITQLSAAFIAADMDIKELMRALLERPEFWAQANRRGLVKTPTQFMVDFYRCVGLQFIEQQGSWFMDRMGQELFAPPNVAGWGVNGYWLSTATMWGRARFATDRRWIVNETGFLNVLMEMEAPEGTELLLETFRIHEPSAATRDAILRWFESTKVSNEWALPPVGISVTTLAPEFQVI